MKGDYITFENWPSNYMFYRWSSLNLANRCKRKEVNKKKFTKAEIEENVKRYSHLDNKEQAAKLDISVAKYFKLKREFGLTKKRKG